MNFFLQEFLHCLLVRVLFIYYSPMPILTCFWSIFTKTCLQSLLSYSIYKSSPAFFLLSVILSYVKPAPEDSYTTVIVEFIYLVLFYEKRLLFPQYESVSRLLNFFLIILSFLLESTHPDLVSIFFQLVNFEVLFHSWLLIQELSTFSLDLRMKKKTFAIALGRYESYKMFTLFQILFYSLVLVDCINNKPLKALVFLLIPWTCYFVFLIRNMKMSSFSLNYFIFSLISSLALIVF